MSQHVTTDVSSTSELPISVVDRLGTDDANRHNNPHDDDHPSHEVEGQTKTCNVSSAIIRDCRSCLTCSPRGIAFVRAIIMTPITMILLLVTLTVPFAVTDTKGQRPHVERVKRMLNELGSERVGNEEGVLADLAGGGPGYDAVYQEFMAKSRRSWGIQQTSSKKRGTGTPRQREAQHENRYEEEQHYLSHDAFYELMTNDDNGHTLSYLSVWGVMGAGLFWARPLDLACSYLTWLLIVEEVLLVGALFVLWRRIGGLLLEKLFPQLLSSWASGSDQRESSTNDNNAHAVHPGGRDRLVHFALGWVVFMFAPMSFLKCIAGSHRRYYSRLGGTGAAEAAVGSHDLTVEMGSVTGGGQMATSRTANASISVGDASLTSFVAHRRPVLAGGVAEGHGASVTSAVGEAVALSSTTGLASSSTRPPHSSNAGTNRRNRPLHWSTDHQNGSTSTRTHQDVSRRVDGIDLIYFGALVTDFALLCCLSACALGLVDFYRAERCEGLLVMRDSYSIGGGLIALVIALVWELVGFCLHFTEVLFIILTHEAY